MICEPTDVAVRAEMRPLLTNEDLERLLQVNRRTVARLVQRGELPAPIRLGGGVRWRPEDIDDALERLASRRGRRKEVGAAAAV